MPSYPFHCSNCELEFDLVMTIKEYDTTSPWQCVSCKSGILKKDRIMCAASVTRASFVDGTKRPGFAELKELNKLKLSEYNMKPEDRKDIRKARKEMEKKI